jgi:nucleoside-diphosphate kinase
VKDRNIKFTKELCRKFYQPHINKPFYNDLEDYMTSGESCALVLKKINAISEWRDLMGASKEKKGDPNSIRAKYGTDKTKDAVHGSDSKEEAKRELNVLFQRNCCIII